MSDPTPIHDFTCPHGLTWNECPECSKGIEQRYSAPITTAEAGRLGGSRNTEALSILTGHDAIRYAEKHGLTLSKYTDPEEDARAGIPPDVAREIARVDPSLIYLSVSPAVALGRKGGSANSPKQAEARAKPKEGSGRPMVNPSANQLRLAAEWMDACQGEDREDLLVVKAYLERKATRRAEGRPI